MPRSRTNGSTPSTGTPVRCSRNSRPGSSRPRVAAELVDHHPAHPGPVLGRAAAPACPPGWRTPRRDRCPPPAAPAHPPAGPRACSPGRSPAGSPPPDCPPPRSPPARAPPAAAPAPRRSPAPAPPGARPSCARRSIRAPAPAPPPATARRSRASAAPGSCPPSAAPPPPPPAPPAPAPPRPPSTATAAFSAMFCALNGATFTPARRNSRHNAVTSRLLPTDEAVPWTISVRAGMARLYPS